MKQVFPHSGFTLIELIVVISIIAIFSAIGLYNYSQVQASARDSQRMQIMASIQVALERYYDDLRVYPPISSFGELYDALNPDYIGNLRDPNPSCVNGPQNTGDWIPCPAGSLVSYRSIPVDFINCPSASPVPGQGYTLELVREGGGASRFFCSQ